MESYVLLWDRGKSYDTLVNGISTLSILLKSESPTTIQKYLGYFCKFLVQWDIVIFLHFLCRIQLSPVLISDVKHLLRNHL